MKRKHPALRDWAPGCTATVAVGSSRQNAACATVHRVPKAAFTREINRALLKHFPGGNTTVDGQGVWMCKRGGVAKTIKEAAAVITISDSGKGCATLARRAETLARRLARTFRQDSALVRVESASGPACMAFVKRGGSREKVSRGCRIVVPRHARTASSS